MKKIGYCSVYFHAEGRRTRWAIMDEWEPLGAHTLKQVTISTSTETIVPGTTEHALVGDRLQQLLVDAAERMDLGTIPCRSYALMLHLNCPCFSIDVDLNGQAFIQAMPTRSWRKADSIIDLIEKEAGLAPATRIRREGDRVTVIAPVDPANPVFEAETLTGTLLPLGRQLQEVLDRHRET